jgi:hypothetical protein
LTLLPLLLMTPASADGPNLPPVPPVTVQVDPPPPPSADPDLATNYGSLIHGDLPPDDAVAGNLLPDPNAPWPAPYVTVEDPTPVQAPNDGGNTCRWYQTARWLQPDDGTCPPVHWATGKWYVEDDTKIAWPVKAAVDAWNAGTGGKMTIGYGCSKIVDGQKYHCVKVVQGHYGTAKPNDWVGLTRYQHDFDNHGFIWATIQLNDDYRMGWAGHMQAIVHELGHAAGLGHEMTNVGPMWYKDDGQHQSPNSAEFGQLNLHTYN